MDPLSLIINSGIVLIQSVICISYACRTNDKIEEINAKIRNLIKQTALRIQRIENAAYHPPQLPPQPSAPEHYVEDPYTYSPIGQPKSYESYGI
jgi:hypothetical protein